jgi:hypothetical protein
VRRHHRGPSCEAQTSMVEMQCDEISLWEKTPKSPTICLSKLTLTVEQSSPKMWATYVIFKYITSQRK